MFFPIPTLTAFGGVVEHTAAGLGAVTRRRSFSRTFLAYALGA
jgi:hypothetical protein